jgi:hypothetical protein
MSTSLCRYGITHNGNSVDFLVAIMSTAPYKALVLPYITALFYWCREVSTEILKRILYLHRPIPILAYLFALYKCSQKTPRTINDFCDYAVVGNNIPALAWLRDPKTSDGVYPWSTWTCLYAARHGHSEILQRLRDPNLDGGRCPWNKIWCYHEALRLGHLNLAAWIETQPDA